VQAGKEMRNLEFERAELKTKQTKQNKTAPKTDNWLIFGM